VLTAHDLAIELQDLRVQRAQLSTQSCDAGTCHVREPLVFGIGTPTHVCYGPEADIWTCYSITSSAATSKPGGIASPIALAAFTLTNISNRVGACTGSSAGLSPRRMRST